MKKLMTLMIGATFTAAPVFAANSGEPSLPEQSVVETADEQTEEFLSDEHLQEGFLSTYANRAIAKSMAAADNDIQLKYGRTVTDNVTAPKIGGYFIGKYAYSDADNDATAGGGFSQRLIRFYVDGTILKDFAYRFQLQTNNASFHMKDFFVEWKHFDELKVKIGQYKRAFTFENPMNPWDVGTGDYSQLVKKLAGMGDDFVPEASATGGRDQGIQLQGDVLRVGKDKHHLVHYQLMLANGQGINTGDANKRKDILGTIQLQPVKGLFVGFFGWKGNYTANGLTTNRDRYVLSAKYDANGWTARAEYGHHTGYKMAQDKNSSKWYVDKSVNKADAWYATLGIPCTSWLKTYVKYDVYRSQATWDSMNTIYSIVPNIQLHKNLMFQLQYNFVNKRNVGGHTNHSEFWMETYVRF